MANTHFSKFLKLSVFEADFFYQQFVSVNVGKNIALTKFRNAALWIQSTDSIIHVRPELTYSGLYVILLLMLVAIIDTNRPASSPFHCWIINTPDLTVQSHIRTCILLEWTLKNATAEFVWNQGRGMANPYCKWHTSEALSVGGFRWKYSWRWDWRILHGWANIILKQENIRMWRNPHRHVERYD